MTDKFDNTNRVALWENENKRAGKTDRDLQGNMTVECPHCAEKSDFWVSLWYSTKENAPFISGSIQFKEAEAPKRGPSRTATRVPPAGRGRPAPRKKEEDDDLPPF